MDSGTVHSEDWTGHGCLGSVAQVPPDFAAEAQDQVEILSHLHRPQEICIPHLCSRNMATQLDVMPRSSQNRAAEHEKQEECEEISQVMN